MNGLVINNLRFQNLGPFHLKVLPGRCAGVSGPSGIGKSLFLRAIADMDENQGRVFLGETERNQLDGPGWRKKVSLLPAESAWWFETVGEHFPCMDFGKWHHLGFGEDVQHWPVTRLSSGERQRLSILRVLSAKPEVLLLDEPTANLDRKNVRLAENLLVQYKNETPSALIWVSHDPEQLERVADAVYRLDEKGLHGISLSQESDT